VVALTNLTDLVDYRGGMALITAAPPTYDDVEVVVPAPGPGAGNWAGAASAVLVDGVFWLTWRVRRPLTDGRGVSVVVARSSDGVTFEPVTEVSREAFGAESFERPVLVPLREGGWRLYLSCATPGSKHWWVDSLTAGTVEALPNGVRRRVHEGDRHTGVKDPVITVGDDGYEMWLCCHPLDEPGHEDRITTRRLTSADGLDWQDHGEVLAGSAGGVGRTRGQGQRRAPRRERAVRRPPGRGVQLVRDHRGRVVGRRGADTHRPAPDLLTACGWCVPLRHRGAPAGRPGALLRRGGPPRRCARPRHLRALTLGTRRVTVAERSA